MTRAVSLCSLLAISGVSAACGGGSQQGNGTTVTTINMDDEVITVNRPAHARVAPPASGPASDLRFPAIARAQTRAGLELDTVAMGALPVIYFRLVIKSGEAADPAAMPGVAHLVAEMLKEGTRTRSSAQLAEEVEFLGASLDIGSDEESIYISGRCLKDQMATMLEILADVAQNPAFTQDELDKLKRREIDRLQLQLSDPSFLAAREVYATLYGTHPYARIDTTEAVVNRVTRADLQRWHRTHFVPNNAFLVTVGDTTPDAVATTAERVFARWRRGNVVDAAYPATPTRTERKIIVVDRVDSVQSVISVANLALARRDPQYVPLMIANQVLGGSPAARLFMDLRERRSLTYGAGSRVGESVDVAPFRAYASVRNAVTAEAMSAFMEHLDRIVTEAPPAEELNNAQRFLSDSFPLRIETPGKIADLVAQLRIYGLPDDYWDTFRTQIRAVTAEQTLAAARQYIHPESAVIVVVGKAADVAEPLRLYGDVTIVSPEGVVGQTLPRLPAGTTAAPAAAAPAAAAPASAPPVTP
jgi:zinc protease